MVLDKYNIRNISKGRMITITILLFLLVILYMPALLLNFSTYAEKYGYACPTCLSLMSGAFGIVSAAIAWSLALFDKQVLSFRFSILSLGAFIVGMVIQQLEEGLSGDFWPVLLFFACLAGIMAFLITGRQIPCFSFLVRFTRRQEKPLVAMVSAAMILAVIIPFLFILHNKLNIPDFDKTGGYTISCGLISETQLDDSTINEVCAVLRKRLDPAGKFGVLIHYQINQGIKICVPVRKGIPNLLDNPEHLRCMVEGAGVLEFRILRTYDHSDLSSEEIDSFLEQLRTQGPENMSTDKYIWIPVRNTKRWHNANAIAGEFEGKVYVLASNDSSNTMLRSPQSGWSLQRASITQDSVGHRAIGFLLDDKGGINFSNITGNNINRPLCIVLDGLALSAPVISSRIFRNGIISGSFDELEAWEIANKLNADCLPVPVQAFPETIEWIVPRGMNSENGE